MLGMSEIACRAGFHHAPRVHHDDAVAERHHERQVVADGNEARVVLFDHLVENPEHLHRDEHVERAGRLIGDEKSYGEANSEFSESTYEPDIPSE
jgi:hypothetical protein